MEQGQGIEVARKEHEPRIAPSPEFSKRILVGPSRPELLNPNTPSVAIQKDELGTPAQRDYTIFNTRSDEERKDYWSQQEQKTFDEQKEVWLSQTLSLFTNAKEFFTTSNKGKEWSMLFKHLDIDTQNITKEQIEAFYDRYLHSANKKGEGIKKFVQDVLDVPVLKSSQGEFSRALLQKHLDAIEWIAGVFGEKSSQVISRLTDAEAQAQTDPDSLANATDPTLSDKEIELLEFLSGEKYKKPPEIPEKPYEERPHYEERKDDITDSVLDQQQPEQPQRETPSIEADTEMGLEKRVEAQKNYIERIKNRYTAERLTDMAHIARFGETRDGKKVTLDEQQKARKEAARLQNFLISLNQQPKDYITELEELNKTLPPMQENTRLSIVIPAYREEKRIQQTLESWINQLSRDNQPIDPTSIEILILVNRPNDQRDFDQTTSMIEEFKKTHPAFTNSIHAVEKTFNFPMTKKRQADGAEIETPEVSMGIIYRLVTDLALIRNLSREGNNKTRIANHAIRTGGADVVARNPHHVDRILTSFDNDPHLEQYVSLSDYPPSVYKKIPLLFLARHLYDHMNDRLTQGLSHIGLGTYRASLYAEAGGFEYRAKIAEEMELSKRMRDVIVAKKQDMQVARKRDLVLNALDDPRRDIAALFVGRPLTQAYSDYDVNEAVRTLDIDQVLTSPLPSQAELSLENMNTQADAILKSYLGLFVDPKKGVFEADSADITATYFKESLAQLGIPPEHIVITYNGQPYSKALFAEELRRSTQPIHELREKFSISITTLPSPKELERIAEKQYQEKNGEWGLSF